MIYTIKDGRMLLVVVVVVPKDGRMLLVEILGRRRVRIVTGVDVSRE